MFSKIVAFLNGKKTVIGSAVLILSGIADESTLFYKILYLAGSILAGTGIIHKRKKREI